MESKTAPVFRHDKYIMPRSAKSVSEAVDLIAPLVDKPLRNKELNITGTISKRSLKKFRDGGAVKLSVSPQLHAMAVANVDTLFENADFKIDHADRANDMNIGRVHRLGTLMFDDVTYEYIPVKITVKEYTDGSDNRIYSIEALDIEKARGDNTPQAEERNSAGHTTGSDAPDQDLHPGTDSSPRTEFNHKIIDLLEKVNRERENK